MGIRNLDHALRPQCLAVLTAGAAPRGHQLLHNVMQCGYRGEVYAIDAHPRRAHPGGTNTQVRNLPSHADLAVLDAPPALIPDLFSACAEGGLPGVLVLPDNIPHGPLERIARTYPDTRLIGPGSSGLIVPALQLNASVYRGIPTHGGLALVTSSGTLWKHLLKKAEDQGVGLSHLVSLGDQVDVDLADLVDYLDRRGRVRSLVIDVDHLNCPSKLLTAVWAFARDRPLFACCDLADEDRRIFACAIRRSGAVPLIDRSAITACLELLARVNDPPQGDSVAIITDRSDSLPPHTSAFRAPDLTPELRAHLQRLGCTEQQGVITVEPATTDERFLTIVNSVLNEPSVHAVLLHTTIPRSPSSPAQLADLASHSALPLVVAAECPQSALQLRQAGLPVFDSLGSGIAALSCQTDYVRNLEKLHRPWGRPPSRPAYHVIQSLPDGELPARPLRAFLRSWGIPVAMRRDPCTLTHLRVELRHHPRFGPVVAVGPADSLEEAVFELVPQSEPLVHAMLTELPLELPEAAREALTNHIVQISEIAVACPQVVALTLCPVAISTHNAQPLDATAVINRSRRKPELCLCPYPDHLAQSVSLKDGTRACVRPIRPDDNALWCRMLESSSHESLRLRYHSVHHRPSRRMALRHCCIDYRRELVLVAEVIEQGQPALAGEGELFLDPDLDLAEFAVFVADHWQGIGLGGLLTDRMVALAEERGARRVACELTPDNVRMITILQRRGFQVCIMIEDAVVFAERTF